MATTTIARPRSLRMPLTRETAHHTATDIVGEADGVRRVTAFLRALHSVTDIGLSVDDDAREWLSSILFPWVEERAAEIERTAKTLETFLKGEAGVA